jgi:glycosyltransferase involved in cell wall biosynthesis
MSVYKKERPENLDQSLSSIEKQTLPPDEIVLVQDGPIDIELSKIIEKHLKMFKGEFRVVRLPINQGLGEALRQGTKYVTTDWIMRMDTDDICVNNRFELQLNAIKKDPTIAVIGGQIDEFTDNPNNIIGFRKVPVTEKQIKSYLSWRCPFNHPSVLINKSKLFAAGGYQSFGTFEDYYLWCRMIAKGYCVKNLPDVLVHMRVNDSLYERRGDPSNIRYILRLQSYMYKHHLVNSIGYSAGLTVKVFNILVSGKIRKFIYRKIIHKREQ